MIIARAWTRTLWVLLKVKDKAEGNKKTKERKTVNSAFTVFLFLFITVFTEKYCTEHKIEKLPGPRDWVQILQDQIKLARRRLKRGAEFHSENTECLFNLCLFYTYFQPG